MNSRYILLLILFMFVIININQVFAITENFTVSPDKQKTFDVFLNENQKVFFQIFVDGGENDDIRLKIIDNNTDSVYFNGIIREEKQDTEYEYVILPAYKSEINNSGTDTKKLIFIFDNSFSTFSSKNVDFTYNVLTESSAYFEQTAFWSWIYALAIIIMVIIITIVVIVIVIKKIKGKRNK